MSTDYCSPETLDGLFSQSSRGNHHESQCIKDKEKRCFNHDCRRSTGQSQYEILLVVTSM
jgi:hypothetical protein